MIRPLEAIGHLGLVWLVGWMIAALIAARSVRSTRDIARKCRRSFHVPEA
jgi:hypothetical protein